MQQPLVNSSLFYCWFNSSANFVHEINRKLHLAILLLAVSQKPEHVYMSFYNPETALKFYLDWLRL